MPIKPIIGNQFNGDIWRIEIDELTDTIFLEIRENQDKKASFAAFNLFDGILLFKNITTPERWLTGIEAAYDGVLLLHFYQTESGPAHKGLMAVEAKTGKTLWSNYTYTFDYLSANGPVVFEANIQPKKFFLVDVKTGATIPINGPSAYIELNNKIVLPENILPGDLSPGLLQDSPFGNSIHYLEYNNFRIVSLHTLKGSELRQMLFVFNEGVQVYGDILNTAIQKLQPEAFIMHKNRLIYIKGKAELKVLTL